MSRFFSLLIFLMATTGYAKDCTHETNSLKCVRYVKNYDADTVTFEIPNVHPIIGRQISIRVSGVDTPELRTKDKCEKQLGYKAKEYVAHLFKNAKRIDLGNIQRGKYFRIVAEVQIDGEFLSEKLLKKGYAYPYEGGTKKKIDWCEVGRKIASEEER